MIYTDHHSSLPEPQRSIVYANNDITTLSWEEVVALKPNSHLSLLNLKELYSLEKKRFPQALFIFKTTNISIKFNQVQAMHTRYEIFKFFEFVRLLRKKLDIVSPIAFVASLSVKEVLSEQILIHIPKTASTLQFANSPNR